MLKEFFAPLWDFLFDKLGVLGLIAAPLIAILLFALALCLVVFILALPKLIFDQVKANRRKKAAYLAEDGEYKEAFRLFEKSGNKGKFTAEELYYYALCLEKTGRKAGYWYQRAVEAGYQGAEIALAKFDLMNAKEKPEKAVRAAALLRESGSSEARAVLDAFYKNTQVDPLYQRAVLGDVDAQFIGGKYSYGEGNTENGIFWLKQAAEQGHKEAADYLGHIYTGGYKTPANYKEAIRWFEKLGNDAEAQYNIAVCYYKLMAKRAEEKNLKTGFDRVSDYEYLNYSMSYHDYMQRAAENGYAKAKEILRK